MSQTEAPTPRSAEESILASKGLDIQLDAFEGPMDLLLYLIRKNDLDVYNIPISDITEEYLKVLDVLKELNLEVAGSFLVMASTLMQIKAQMLLPSPQLEDEEQGPDPRKELVNKLLEYQRFKEASAFLATSMEKTKDVYYRRVPPLFGEEEYVLKASIFDLLDAFKRVLDEAPTEVGQIIREEIPIEVKIREILDQLEQQDSLNFEELFKTAPRRIDKIVTFLALLELIRLKQVTARQDENFSALRIYKFQAEEADQVPTDADLAPNDLNSQPSEVLNHGA